MADEPNVTLRELAAEASPPDPPADDLPVSDPPVDDPPAPDDDPPGEDETGWTLADLEKHTGLDLSTYDNPQAALKGLAEAKRLVGRRNEEAETFRRLEQAIQGREKEFLQWLNGQTAAAPAPDSTSDAAPKTYAELQLLEQRIYDEHGKVRPGADPALVRQYQQSQQQIAQGVFDLLNNPDKVLSPAMERLKGEILQTVQAMSQQYEQQRQEAAEWTRVVEEHKDLLFDGGDLEKPTAFADKVKNRYYALLDEGMPKLPVTYRMAMKEVQADMPKPQGTRRPNPKGKHEPPVSPPTHETVDAEEFFAERSAKGQTKGMLAEFLKKSGRLETEPAA